MRYAILPFLLLIPCAQADSLSIYELADEKVLQGFMGVDYRIQMGYDWGFWLVRNIEKIELHTLTVLSDESYLGDRVNITVYEYQEAEVERLLDDLELEYQLFTTGGGTSYYRVFTDEIGIESQDQLIVRLQSFPAIIRSVIYPGVSVHDPYPGPRPPRTVSPFYRRPNLGKSWRDGWMGLVNDIFYPYIFIERVGWTRMHHVDQPFPQPRLLYFWVPANDESEGWFVSYPDVWPHAWSVAEQRWVRF